MQTRYVALVAAALVVLVGCQGTGQEPQAGAHRDYAYTNSHTGDEKVGELFAPAGEGDTTPRPLLVFAHWFGGKKSTARTLGYHDECRKRGWYCVNPTMHQKDFVQHLGFGSPEAQHDILDGIAYMKANFRIDSTRIYIAGRSMGGQMTQLMAAKHPDIFAAAVAGQGISHMRTFMASNRRLGTLLEKFAVGKYSDSTAFEYARRSSVSYAANLAYVPIQLWHGTVDPSVPVEQTVGLFDAIRRHCAWQPEPYWLLGAPHGGVRFPLSWVCDNLAMHQSISEPEYKIAGRYYDELELVTDEDKAFFWLRLSVREQGDFGRIKASFHGDTISVVSSNLDSVTILAGLLPDSSVVSVYEANMGGAGVVCLEKDGRMVSSASIVRTGTGTFGDE